MTAQILLTLHECHRMRIYFSEILDFLSGEGTEHMRDAQLQFAYHTKIALAQQFMVLKQRPGYGVFHSHYTQQ